MEAEKVLQIVCREMTQIGYGWRGDWSDFDGRRLRDQLDDLDSWAEKALTSEIDLDYTEGTEFRNERR